MSKLPNSKMMQALRREVSRLDQSKDENYAARQWMDTGRESGGYRFEIVVICNHVWQAALISGFGGYAPTRDRVVVRVAL